MLVPTLLVNKQSMNVTHVRKVLRRLEPGSISSKAAVVGTIHSQPQRIPVYFLKFWGTGKAQVTFTMGDVTNMRLCD